MGTITGAPLLPFRVLVTVALNVRQGHKPPRGISRSCQDEQFVEVLCVLLNTRLLRGVGRWDSKPINDTSWVAVVIPTDRPKSVRNRCLIELFCGVVCYVTLPF